MAKHDEGEKIADRGHDRRRARRQASIGGRVPCDLRSLGNRPGFAFLDDSPTLEIVLGAHQPATARRNLAKPVF